jgi:hypothetical protein
MTKQSCLKSGSIKQLLQPPTYHINGFDFLCSVHLLSERKPRVQAVSLISLEIVHDAHQVLLHLKMPFSIALISIFTIISDA